MLDQLAAKYPDLPDAVRLKAALLYAGVRYDDCLAAAGEWAFPNFMPHHIAPPAPPYKGQRRIPIPYLLRLDDDTQVRLRIKTESPFSIRAAGAARSYTLFEEERPLSGLSFEPKQPWVDSLTADGTPMKATGLSQHGDMLVLNVAPGCEYFQAPLAGGGQENLSCKFCLYGLPDQRMKPLGQELFVVQTPSETMQRVIEACAHPETQARHLYLVGGSLLDPTQEGERFIAQAAALAEHGLCERYYVACGSGAIPRSAMEKLRALGVRGACFNLEVWDPKQFERVCPGKARFVGRDRWIEALTDAVEVFGPENTMTAFVAGAEMDGEGGFTDPEEALASNLAGAETLLERGIQPIFSLHWKMTGKDRGMEPLYSLDLFLRLNLELAKLRRRFNQPINPDFFCHRCAYMQIEPDIDRMLWGAQA